MSYALLRYAVAMKAPSVCAASAYAVLLVGCGTGPHFSDRAVSSSQCQLHAGVSQTITTRSFTMVVEIANGSETMYTQAQAHAEHPQSGEIMLGGSMTEVPLSSGPGTTGHHLELHVCRRSTGQVVSLASPTITVADISTSSPPVSVPVAVMQGVAAGPEDVHYGNNVLLVPGHRYRVAVQLDGESGESVVTA